VRGFGFVNQQADPNEVGNEIFCAAAPHPLARL
jgi:hypothetical protein